MKGNRKGTRAAGIMLGLAAMCAAAWIPRTVYGAGAIDTEKDDCRILFTLDIGGPDTGTPPCHRTIKNITESCQEPLTEGIP